MKKVCKKCNLEQDINSFHKGARMKDGHLNICKTCRIKYNSENKVYISKQRTEHYKNNKGRISIYQKEYSKKNSLKKSAASNDYYKRNKETVKIKKAKYYQENKESINTKIRERKQTDPLYKIKSEARTIINKALKRNGYIKKSKTAQILGCTFNEFKIHLENQFKPWMSWNNHGKYNGQINYGWDIDHIIPLCSAKNEKELLKLLHYTNLQPLCSYVNRCTKRGRVTPPISPI